MTEPSRRLTERENGAETPQRFGLGLNRNNDSGFRSRAQGVTKS